jgi:hypothetical protein
MLHSSSPRHLSSHGAPPKRMTAHDQARALRDSSYVSQLLVKKTAVFMDAGAVFFAVRDMHENQQLSYPALMDLLAKRGFPLPGHSEDDHPWVMWSAAVSQNPGQMRFLQYAERELRWRVRRFAPADGYMVDPLNIGVMGESRNRLMRFDASIAFAIGRIAADHRIAVITDSFAVAEPLLRAARLSRETNVIAFFGRLLDARWQGLLRAERRDEGVPIELVDLDEYDEQLFGVPKPQETTGWNDDFLLTK